MERLLRGDTISAPLRGWVGRAAMAVFGLCAVVGLVYLALSRFAVGSLTDRRAQVEPEVLVQAARFFPQSSRLQWTLADTELVGDDSDIQDAKSHAELAVALCPDRFEYRLTLAAAQEALGDQASAEQSLRAAVALAPNNASVRWQLANLLFRERRLTDSLDQFKLACGFDRSLTPSMLSLVWGSLKEQPAQLEAVVPTDAESHLLLAKFLANQGSLVEAGKVFNATDPALRRTSSETPPFIDLLMTNGAPQLAKSIWTGLVSPAAGEDAIVWNGGFESKLGVRPFSRFDWILKGTKYAQIGLDDSSAHSGNRSLKINFAGIDTTRLDGEVAQSIVLRLGETYHCTFYAKTDGLVTPEGPKVSISIPGSQWEVASSPVAAGSGDWRLISFDFKTPQQSSPSKEAAPMHPDRLVQPFPRAPLDRQIGGDGDGSVLAVLSIVRRPAFSYDDPTRGNVWFDDFAITEMQTQK